MTERSRAIAGSRCSRGWNDRRRRSWFGHGELGGGELITIYREYLEELREETRKLAANGQDADAIIGTLIPQMLGRHPDWDASEPWRIATAVQSFLAR